jgi:hypothetical protein
MSKIQAENQFSLGALSSPFFPSLIKPVSGYIDFRQMLLDPSSECQDRFRHRTTQLGQPVFHLWRASREDRSGHHAVAFETAQGTGQTSAARVPFDVVEAPGSLSQQHDDQHADVQFHKRKAASTCMYIVKGWLRSG